MSTLFSINENSEPIYLLNEVLEHITCPKCYEEQPASDECIYCGIIFTGFLKKEGDVLLNSVEEEMGLAVIESSGMLKKVLICFVILRIIDTGLSFLDDWVNPPY